MIPIIFLSFLLSFSHASAQGFCVADYSAPSSPAGYSCKKPKDVTVDDFAFSGLATAGNTANLIKANATLAFAPQLPGLNGQGISILRADMAPGGVFPLHSHPDATELILVAEGSILAGFIAADSTVYQKTLNQWDVMVVPVGLLHFVVNPTNSSALVFASFSSSNPAVQTLDLALFRSDLPTQTIVQTTFLDADQVKKLKSVFGGSG